MYKQLSIVGELDGKPSYLAFGGVVMSHETYCSPQPSTAQKGTGLTINQEIRIRMELRNVFMEGFSDWRHFPLSLYGQRKQISNPRGPEKTYE